MQRQNALELSNMYPKPRTSPVGAPARTGSDRSLAQLQIQRTEIGMRRGRQPGSTKATCPVCVLIADGPDQERSTEWVCVRFNIDARPEDQLSLIQLTVLQQARTALNDQIAVLEKRFGRAVVAR